VAERADAIEADSMSGSQQSVDSFDLERFVQAQAPMFAQVIMELAAGRKRSHWMWFVFPQLRGLGRSATAHYYAIAGLAEAQAYLRHPILGTRLVECTSLVNAAEVPSAHALFGSPDDLKFRSCMSLFSRLPHAPAQFQQALDRYFAGDADPLTLQLLRAS
jgi:uncharacterized protein (DUF1810 family)